MSELNMLRCQLRAVNIEYSALVRRKTGEGAYARMAELRVERGVLMALIARQGAILEYFTNLGRKLGTITIAEGMETAEQLSIHTS